MKTVFKEGMKVYDQVNFPNLEGKIEEIYISEGQEYPIVLFEGKKERVCYNFEGCLSDCTTKTLSTKPYKIEFQGFEQKAPTPTFEEVLVNCDKRYPPNIRADVYFKEIYPSKELSDAAESLRRLLFLRDYYNEGWKPDWEDDEWKYIIENYRGEIGIERNCGNSKILAFKTREIRDKFLEEQRELLEIAKPLL